MIRRIVAAGLGLVALGVVGLGIAVWIGAKPPGVTIETLPSIIGQASPVAFTVTGQPGDRFDVAVSVEQGGRSFAVFRAGEGGATPRVVSAAPGHPNVSLTIGKASVPELTDGPARVLITASRSVFLGWRTLKTTALRDVKVRLQKPLLVPLSTQHYINQGGCDTIAYRVTPADVTSGVQVGNHFYPGFQAGAADPAITDPATHLALFALLYDQDPSTPMKLVARDEAGNTADVPFTYKVFPKNFRASRIEINDTFLDRVVPAILEHTPDMKDTGDRVKNFLEVNGRLRQIDAKKIAAFASRSDPRWLWSGPFLPLGNAQVEAAFADHRTYFYQGQEIDRQVHLGFDLAVTTNVPVIAANEGRVVWADYLGIYGNAIILDHGTGLQSLYAHLSAFEVKPGDPVKKGQEMGRSGQTGLAAGDHVHFTVLLDGWPVNPVEWWDPHWIHDRVMNKVAIAANPAAAATVAAPAARAPAPAARTGRKARRHR